MQAKNINKVELLLVICALSFFYLTGLQYVEFHPDESQWIATSSAFEAYFKADFKSPLWDKTYWTLTQPPVVRYIIGFSRYLGGYRIPDLNRPWDFGRGEDFNLRMEAMPSPGLLWWSRLPMAILAVLSLALVFNLLRASAGRFSAYIWLGLIFLNPYFPLQLRRAMGESSLLFFTILTAYSGYQISDLAERKGLSDIKPMFMWLGLSGIAAGLASASKLNGIESVAVSALIPFLLVYRQKLQWRFAFLGSIWVTALAILTFVIVNPFLWPSPLSRTIAMFQNRLMEMGRQTTTHSADYISNWEQRFQLIPTRIFETYAVPVPLLINLGLFMVGLGLLIYATWEWVRRKQISAVFPVLTLTAFFTSIPALFTPIDWDRYYLFPVFFSTICIAMALGWAGQRAFRYLSPKFQKISV